MRSGLGTITIADDGHNGHVAYEMTEKDGLLFAGEELLRRAKAAKRVIFRPLSAATEHRIRIGSVDASCANFLILT
ncbi:hypothetical protein ACIQUB_13245 [Rhizobium sp. NPDC090275]|jgi:hypothetical protein|nr:hypothetical protein [Rhizobium sp. 16-488-2b]MBO9178029.1 hypothetical protein [Rhizobium sp. 16-488-2a]MBO9197820.1 hypothetical protein [Rhizobium sp. 16-449-1b]